MSKTGRMTVTTPLGVDLVSHITGSLCGGGAYRDRTDDLMLAKQPLSQLS
jgi:hypothetical protein